MNLICHAPLILLFVLFGTCICVFLDNLFHPCCSPTRAASCACGIGGLSSGSGGDGEGGEECATGAQ